ncbi:MAG: hypothetical protein RJB62_1329, partial [Pseudomonadota bacterium]
PDEIDARARVARRYNASFAGAGNLRTPYVVEGAQSVWAQYTLQVENRAKFQADLKGKGIPTAVYYPIPLGKQRAYKHYPAVPMPVSDALSERVVSLPMHPYLDETTQDRIIAAVLESVNGA